MNISVIIPTYNYASYIRWAIDSVLSQTYQDNLEIIIIDDGSTDNTEEIIKSTYSDQVTYIKQKNKGKANATRKAIERATGDVIFNLDADDYYLPNKIRDTMEIFEGYPEVVHVATPALCKQEDKSKDDYIELVPSFLLNKAIEGHEVLRYFYMHRILFGGGSTFAGRSSVLKKIDIPDGVDMYIDEYLILATLAHGKSYFFERPLSVWRIHTNNYSGNKKDTKTLEIKGRRLLNSSLATLQAIHQLPLPIQIKKLYTLQHYVRNLSFKESLSKKTLIDIIAFGWWLLTCGLTFKIIKNQTAFNRLVPTTLLLIIKRYLK